MLRVSGSNLLGVLGVCCLLVAMMAKAETYGYRCDKNFTDIQAALETIEQELKKTTTRVEYQESVKQRFDRVENLLTLVTTCIDTGQMERENARQWHQLKMTLASLQASAQVSAFTKFDDWVTAKELDLSAFENARTGKW